MKPFADENMVAGILERFYTEDIVKIENDNVVTLTEKGQELHKLCFEQQQLFRQKAMTGISKQDYLTTVSTLQKMVKNISKPKE